MPGDRLPAIPQNLFKIGAEYAVTDKLKIGADAVLVVGIVTGFGELAGYGMRLASGRLADSTGKFWPITIFGRA
jgi:hypothetical protein